VENFATFILTHGRAKNVVTYRSLMRSGYTGKLFILLDDEDDQRAAYEQEYGDAVVVFNKQEYVGRCDSGNNLGKRAGILFARHAAYDVARKLGLRYFWQLDDDYTTFNWSSDNRGRFLNANASSRILNIDNVLAACLEFLETSGAKTLAFSQGGDFIGGGKGRFAMLAAEGRFARKAMNTFLCHVDRPIDFRGIMNEDVTAYVVSGGRGELFFTAPRLRVSQLPTQSQGGGVSDMYRDYGTYVKAFTTVMYAPSCVKVSMMGDTNRRVHHMVQWKYAVPRIISDKYRKAR